MGFNSGFKGLNNPDTFLSHFCRLIIGSDVSLTVTDRPTGRPVNAGYCTMNSNGRWGPIVGGKINPVNEAKY